MLQPRRIITYCFSVASFVCVVYLIISVDLYSSDNYSKPKSKLLGLQRPKPKSNFLSEIKVPSKLTFQETTEDGSPRENEKLKDTETNGFVVKRTPNL
jgi:hypothetical protein